MLKSITLDRDRIYSYKNLDLVNFPTTVFILFVRMKGKQNFGHGDLISLLITYLF